MHRDDKALVLDDLVDLPSPTLKFVVLFFVSCFFGTTTSPLLPSRDHLLDHSFFSFIIIIVLLIVIVVIAIILFILIRVRPPHLQSQPNLIPVFIYLGLFNPAFSLSWLF